LEASRQSRSSSRKADAHLRGAASNAETKCREMSWPMEQNVAPTCLGRGRHFRGTIAAIGAIALQYGSLSVFQIPEAWRAERSRAAPGRRRRERAAAGAKRPWSHSREGGMLKRIRHAIEPCVVGPCAARPCPSGACRGAAWLGLNLSDRQSAQEPDLRPNKELHLASGDSMG
jgi:hypothetical protein